MPIAGQAGGIRAAVVAAVDRAFAEPVRLLPLFEAAVDSSREAVDFLAVLRVGEGDQSNFDGGRDRSWRTQLGSGQAELHISRIDYPTLRIRQGDKIVALSRPGEPMWEVLRPDDRGDSRLVLELGEA